MSDSRFARLNIALLGGGEFCREVIQKIRRNSPDGSNSKPIMAVADENPNAPGMIFARENGILTFTDYHELYQPRYNIGLIILLDSDSYIFKEVLETRPLNIRILSFEVFQVFWNAIAAEERKLRERTEEMETILNGIEDFILIISPDMNIINANDSFIIKRQLPMDQVIGRKCHEVFRYNDQACDELDSTCPLQNVIKNKRPFYQTISRLGRDKQVRYYEIGVFPIWEKDGKISRFIHISRNITDRKQEEEKFTRQLEEIVEQRTRQLKDTHEKLLHQDKMASLGKLAASMVHEINNPIAGILNLILLIKRITNEGIQQAKDIEQFKMYLDLMETETRRIGRIVSNLLAFSRQSKIELKSLDLTRLLDIALMMNANAFKLNNVQVETNFADNLPPITGSEDQLQQVFMNFVSNAVESMENTERRVLTIETQHLLADNKISVVFQDTGIGISNAIKQKIYDPFFTTKTKSKGVGLGLSVAYGIVKEHNGCINLESEPGKGARFELLFPLKAVRSDSL